MSHLTPDTMVDALDGRLDQASRLHLDDCAACRQQVQELAAVVEGVAAVRVPEPSPLFWDHLSARVRQEVGGSERPARTRWFDWRVLMPAAGVAALVIALVGVLPDTVPDEPVSVATSAAPVADDEAPWELVAALLAEVDFDDAAGEGPSATTVAWRGAADRVVLELSTAEQEELLRLLREEVRAGG